MNRFRLTSLALVNESRGVAYLGLTFHDFFQGVETCRRKSHAVVHVGGLNFLNVSKRVRVFTDRLLRSTSSPSTFHPSGGGKVERVGPAMHRGLRETWGLLFLCLFLL